MTAEKILLSGYVVTREGASIWPWRKPKYRWAGVGAVSTRADFAKGGCVSEIKWKGGATFVIGSGRSRLLWGGMERHCDALALVLAGLPSDASVDAKSRHLARWGTAEVAKRVAANVSLRPEPVRLLEAANHHWARMDARTSRRTLERLLAEHPDHVEGARLFAELLVESASKVAAVTAALENWRRLEPHSEGWREHLSLAYLAGNDERGVPMMQSLRAAAPANLAWAGTLAGYHLRRGEYANARAVMEHCAAHATDPVARREAWKALTYVSRWGESRWFRGRQKVKQVAFLVVPWVVAVLLVGFQLYAFYEKRERGEISKRQRAEWDQRRQTDTEQMARTPHPLTGWVLGSMEKIREVATEGNAAAQYTLGARLMNGLGLPANPAEGFQWLERAAAQDNRGALCELGDYYRFGRHVPEDLARMFGYYRRAADLGSPRGAFEAGECYRQGRGVEADEAAAVRYYRRAAEGDNVFGQRWLGWCLENGKGVAVDRDEAIKWYRAAAKKKNVWSALRLAALYGEPSSPLHDVTEAFRWLEVAGNSGSTDAQLRLGLMRAVGKPVPQDVTAARQWLEKAAKAGLPEALWLLGEFDWQGVGEARNTVRAIARWEEAAKSDHVLAMQRLSVCRIFGLGVAVDLSAAENLLARLGAKDAASAGELKNLMAALSGLTAASVESGDDRAAEVVVQPRPFYPVMRNLEGREGTAMIRFVVTEDGRVTAAKIVSSTEPEFGIAALSAVELWRFRPGRREGRPVTTEFEVPVVFTLENARRVKRPAAGP